MDETAKLIIATALDVDVSDTNGVTALMVACEERSILPTSESVIQFLLDKGANINAIGKNGESALGFACRGGHSWLVQELLQRGASPEQVQQHFDQTPIYYACQQENANILKLLLEYGATINSSKRPADNDLFVTAVNSDAQDVIRLLMESDPVHFLFAKTVEDESALHIACRVGVSSVTVQWLVDAVSNKNGVDKRGLTPLHHAVSGGDVDLVRLLIDARSSQFVKDREGYTALDVAIQKGKTEMAVVLIEAMACLGSNALHLASAIDNVDVMVELLKRSKNNNWYRPRETAGRHPGGVINDPVFHEIAPPADSGESPLHIATKNKILNNMILLLDAGADVNIKHTKTGATPLHYAAKDHWKEGISLLLKRGGDKEIASARGLLPRDILSLTAGPRVVELERRKGRPPVIPRGWGNFKNRFRSGDLGQGDDSKRRGLVVVGTKPAPSSESSETAAMAETPAVDETVAGAITIESYVEIERMYNSNRNLVTWLTLLSYL
jgi:ankyrin repeat protein